MKNSLTKTLIGLTAVVALSSGTASAASAATAPSDIDTRVIEICPPWPQEC